MCRTHMGQTALQVVYSERLLAALTGEISMDGNEASLVSRALIAVVWDAEITTLSRSFSSSLKGAPNARSPARIFLSA